MKLEDLIRRFRALSHDNVESYFWSDKDVTDWLNDAEAQAAIRGRLLREDANPLICRIELQAGQHTYPLHKAAYELIHLRRIPSNGDRARPLHLVSREWLDAEVPHWRDLTEASDYAIQDDKTLRLVGKVEAGDVLALECFRLPLKLLNVDNEKGEPEIHGAHHEHLIQWALHKAFSIPDAEAFDPDRSALAERAFTAYFGTMPDSDLRRATRADVAHTNKMVLV